MPVKESKEDEITIHFNDGRLSADKKWIDAINERIAELEKQVGIPELRRLREKTRYRWAEDEENGRIRGVRRR